MPESNIPISKRPEVGRQFELALQTAFPIKQEQVEAALLPILDAYHVTSCEISIAVVDDPTMHQLNVQFLGHDYPTDVLTFPDDRSTPDQLFGEIIVSSDMAESQAHDRGLDPSGELLMYLIHGLLHLVGEDDVLPEQAERMRLAEQRFLERAGYKYRFDPEEDAV